MHTSPVILCLVVCLCCASTLDAQVEAHKQRKAIDLAILRPCLTQHEQSDQAALAKCIQQNLALRYWEKHSLQMVRGEADSLTIYSLEMKAFNPLLKLNGWSVDRIESFFDSSLRDKKNAYRSIQDLLLRDGYGRYEAFLYRSTDASKEFLIQFESVDNAAPSSIDLNAGFGSQSGFVGEGSIELQNALHPLSSSLLQFSRFAERQNILKVRHQQYQPFFRFGPNQFAFHFEQRNELYSILEADFARTLILKDGKQLQITVQRNQSNVAEGVGANIGLHTSTGVLVKLFKNSFPEAYWNPNAFTYYDLAFANFYKVYDSDLEGISNESGWLRQIHLLAGYEQPLSSVLKVHFKGQLFYSEQQLPLAPSDIMLTNDAYDLPGYAEGRFLYDRRVQFKLALKRRLGAQSFVSIFGFAAQMGVKQEFIDTESTNWFPQADIQNLWAYGFRFSLPGKTNALDITFAISRDAPINNPRLHLRYRNFF